MNADLEEQLKELGPDCRAVVDRLRAARTAEPKTVGLGRRSRSTVEWLIAASLLIALGLTVHIQTIQQSNNPTIQQSSNPAIQQSNNQTIQQSNNPTLSSYGAHEYHLSPAEMIASQNADGSWQNDFLTRRNAEVLANCETLAARIAYKKAMRNLRAKGIL